MFQQIDSTWILYLAITFLPLAVGAIGFIFSVVNRHKIRAMASLGAIMVVTGGAVAAHESEYGYVPSSIEDIQQVPESVRSVAGRAIDDAVGVVTGNKSEDAVSASRAGPRWRPVNDKALHYLALAGAHVQCHDVSLSGTERQNSARYVRVDPYSSLSNKQLNEEACTDLAEDDKLRQAVQHHKTRISIRAAYDCPERPEKGWSHEINAYAEATAEAQYGDSYSRFDYHYHETNEIAGRLWDEFEQREQAHIECIESLKSDPELADAEVRLQAFRDQSVLR